MPILVLDADKSKEEMVQTYLQFRDIIRGSQKLGSGVTYRDSSFSTDSDIASNCEKENVQQVLNSATRNEVRR